MDNWTTCKDTPCSIKSVYSVEVTPPGFYTILSTSFMCIYRMEDFSGFPSCGFVRSSTWKMGIHIKNVGDATYLVVRIPNDIQGPVLKGVVLENRSRVLLASYLSPGIRDEYWIHISRQRFKRYASTPNGLNLCLHVVFHMGMELAPKEFNHSPFCKDRQLLVDVILNTMKYIHRNLGHMCDVKVKCKCCREGIPAHSPILKSVSPDFFKVLTDPDSKKDSTGMTELDLTKWDGPSVHQLIKFFYTGEVDNRDFGPGLVTLCAQCNIFFALQYMAWVTMLNLHSERIGSLNMYPTVQNVTDSNMSVVLVVRKMRRNSAGNVILNMGHDSIIGVERLLLVGMSSIFDN